MKDLINQRKKICKTDIVDTLKTCYTSKNVY